ncbi:hypothetical protein [Bacteroides ihuae]|uniref:hypothetical protein n=1 Tax=Bacteroides ihuae TaxID=1852362 RepID=UPI0008D94A12|nr:hypothetical protein [Bacteroides ihuae]
MRNEELYIDDQLVDLDDNTKVTLNYKSNIFTDLSKIVSNNSYSIKLPNTVHNQCVIDHADLPTRASTFPRIKHRARYFRNGVEIVNKANAVLLSTSDTFDISLLWGNITNFSNIISNKKKLNELNDSDDLFVWWSIYHTITQYGSIQDVIYPKAYYGYAEGEGKYDGYVAPKNPIFYHPCVRASFIMSLIENDYGVKFEFPDTAKAFVDKMLIPMLTRNDSETYAIKLAKDYIAYGYATRNEGGYFLYLNTNDNKINYYGRFTLSNSKLYAYRPYVDKVTLKISGSLVYKVTTKSIPNTARVIIHGQENGDFVGDDVLTINVSTVELQNDGKYLLTFLFNEEETSELVIEQDYYFYMDGLSDVGGAISNVVDSTINIMPYLKEIQCATKGSSINLGYLGTEKTTTLTQNFAGGRYPIIANLPNIDVLTFIKSIAYLAGLFAIPELNNTIRFISSDDIYANVPKAVDWTKKVVATYRENKPMSMSYTLDDFAQKNIFDWKEDDAVGDYSGVITVDDAVLDSERIIVTLPFAACDTKNGMASVLMYTYNSDGYLEYGKREPRLLLEDKYNGEYSKASFVSLDFKTVISTYYASYQKVVRQPIIIKEKIELREIELKSLDVTVPVYLAQYGKYYAIISVKAEDTGICECELLQL